MSEIRARGHIMSFFTYFVCGLVFLFTMRLNTKCYNPNYAAATVLLWLISCVFLISVGLAKHMDGQVYEFLYIIFVSFFGVMVQIFWNVPYLLYLLFMLEWLIVLSFLRKYELHELVFIQTLCLAFLTFTPKHITEFSSFSWISLIISFAALLLADWIECILINALIQLIETNDEHERSLDDLLKIVEEKHKEAKRSKTSGETDNTSK